MAVWGRAVLVVAPRSHPRGAMVVTLYKSTAPNRSPFREAAILAMLEPLGLCLAMSTKPSAAGST